MSVVASARAGRPRAPMVNCSDLPELMPRTRPSANHAQRCSVVSSGEIVQSSSRLYAAPTLGDLETMFPALDPVLVRALAADAPNAEYAIETLLALSGSMAEPFVPVAVDAQTNTILGGSLGMEDLKQFPLLADSEGWQVPTKHLLDRDSDEDLGSAWRDLTKAAAGLTAPVPLRIYARSLPSARCPKARSHRSDDDDEAFAPSDLTEHELRQKIGQRRVEQRTKYGRRKASSDRGNCIADLSEPAQKKSVACSDASEVEDLRA